MTKFTKLFEPIKIGNVEVKNRVYLLPMSTEYPRNYHLTDRFMEFYEQRAKGGVGLINVGSCMVADLEGTNPQYIQQQGTPGLWKDEFIPEWQELAARIKKYGARFCAQLQLYYEWRRDGSHPLEAVGPSAGPGGPMVKQLRELTVEEIQIMISQYGDAARRAREAEADMILIHAGMGYQISRFISPYSNKRTDDYGGSVEKRLRLLTDIIADCQKKAGKDLPITVRISAEEYMPGGNTVEDTKQYVPILEKAGVAALDVQVGFHESTRPLVNQFVPEAAFVQVAAEIKKVTKLPIITGYRIDSPELAEKILNQGQADLIGFGRALIADPELANKAQQGRPETIRRCIVCSRCLESVYYNQGLSCSVNPEIASPRRNPAPGNKKIAIIGAGPAGMEAARITAKRGYKVTLFEKTGRLGGSWNLASILNPNLERPLAWYRRELAQLPIEIRLNTSVTETMLEQMNPEAIIVAPGGEPLLPDVPGVNGNNILKPDDIKELMDGIPPKKGLLWLLAAMGAKTFRENYPMLRSVLNIHWPVKRRLAIIGGGFAGCEVALNLMKGREVTLIEESKKIGGDVGLIDRKTELDILKEGGVRMETLTKVKEFTSAGVKVIKADGTEDFIMAETIMVALGVARNNKLFDQLSKKFPNVHLIGDGVGDTEIRRTREAIRDGYEIGMTI